MLEVLQTLNALSSLPGALMPVFGALLLGAAAVVALSRLGIRTVVATVVRPSPLQVKYELNKSERTIVLDASSGKAPSLGTAGAKVLLEYNPAQPSAAPRVYNERWYVPVASMAGLGAALLAFYFASR